MSNVASLALMLPRGSLSTRKTTKNIKVKIYRYLVKENTAKQSQWLYFSDALYYAMAETVFL